MANLVMKVCKTYIENSSPVLTGLLGPHVLLDDLSTCLLHARGVNVLVSLNQ
jgi:hypothetical protein